MPEVAVKVPFYGHVRQYHNLKKEIDDAILSVLESGQYVTGPALKQFETDYDAVLVPNFFHHFDIPTCTHFLRKVHAALKPGGRCVIVEFVPNEDRVSPPTAASFAHTRDLISASLSFVCRRMGNATFSPTEMESKSAEF